MDDQRPSAVKILEANKKTTSKLKLFVILLIPLMLVGVLFFAVWEYSKAKSLYRQAVVYNEEGKFKKAISNLQIADNTFFALDYQEKIVALRKEVVLWTKTQASIEQASGLLAKGQADEALKLLEGIDPRFPRFKVAIQLRYRAHEIKETERLRSLPAATVPITQISLQSTTMADDQPDDISGHQVHMVYAVPTGTPSRGYNDNGAMSTSVAAIQNWLSQQTGGKSLRMDTHNGKLDVTYLQLKKSESELGTGPELWGRLSLELRQSGLYSHDKLYLVYYEGKSHLCGQANWPGLYAYVYLGTCGAHGLTQNAGRVQTAELTALHELMHAFGAVPGCAPHFDGSAHINDIPADLMYYGVHMGEAAQLDPGRDDYYGHGREDCLDIATSPYLQ